MQFDGSPFDVDPFTDPDVVMQVEDDNPESLAGETVTFDEAAEDSGEDDG